MQDNNDSRPALALRSRPDPASSFPYYLELSDDARRNLWSEKNPDGSVLLSIAENHLSVDLLHEKVSAAPPFPAELFAYGPLSGEPVLKNAVVKLLETTFLQGCALDPDRMFVTAGATNALESLFFAILDPGEGVLVLAPSYAGYVFDIGFRVQGKCLPVYVERDGDVAQQLTEAKAKHEAAGTRIRALLVTQPDNPTGTLFPESCLATLATWCADHRLHLIANEVYANSVFVEEPLPFRSLYKIGRALQRPELQDRLHLVYALSKDFCASGFRVGVIYTESDPVLHRVQAGGLPIGVSRPSQYLIATALQDEAFVQHFIQENKRRLERNYDTLTSALAAAGIGFQRSQAGLFSVIDLRFALKAADFESERALCVELCQRGVYLTPGEACKYREPGFFRVCFGTVPPEALRIAVRRIEQFTCG